MDVEPNAGQFYFTCRRDPILLPQRSQRRMRASINLGSRHDNSDRTLGGTSAGPYLFGNVILASPGESYTGRA